MFKRLFLVGTLLFSLLIILQCTHLKEAKQAYQTEDYKKTMSLCKQAIQADSTDGEAYLLIAQCYQKLNEADSVYKTLSNSASIILQDPNKKSKVIDLYIFTGRKSYEKENLRLAYYAIQDAEALKPEALKQNLNIADFYLNDGQIDKAKEKYKAILKDNPKNQTAIKSLEIIKQKETEADEYIKKGKAAYKKGHFITTKTQLTKALKIKPDDRDAKYFLNLAEGRTLLKKGDKSTLWDAIELFGKAMAIKPDKAEPHYRMGQAYEKKEEHEFINAIDSYKEALRLDPKGPFANSCKKKIKELTKRKEKLDRFWGR